MDFNFNPWAADTSLTTSATHTVTVQGADNAAAPPQPTNALVKAPSPTDFLLIIFIHGFKGTDETFNQFPDRLQHLLTQSLPSVKVECAIFPAYETKGELDKAIIRFADWLTTMVVEKEVACGGGSGKAKVVLCGHSMGGLLAADSLREFVKSRPDKQCPLWPNIIALIAFDTPYLGLHPHIVKNSVTKVADQLNTAKAVGTALFGSFAGFTAAKAASGSSSPAAPNAGNQEKSAWSKWGGPAAYAIGGAVLAGAAAGGALYARDQLTQGYTWATDHLKYVGTLWDEPSMKARVESLVDIEEQDGVVFRNFYTCLPPKLPTYLTSRSFAVLPDYGSRAVSRFEAANNGVAEDEIQAHTGMFSPGTNDGYYELGLKAATLIQEVFQRSMVPQTRTTSWPRPTSPAWSQMPETNSTPPPSGNKVEGDLISF
ncbi:hypothetical protein FA15DRAFT_671630 [Coprinopsis marcescibilis]|uniref:DUF676 domain-containing protein n=1 Tax=Coprinopsis marcescibilis TaxID=230819 RepID=A0A5C3KQ71_COPMA|nr:hypothetical protein FA15DRAFT_671630 [Coprinopsis marcescibilis]